MIRALTRFVDVPWYGPTLDLVNGSYNFKANITKIEVTRANGAGFDNYTGTGFPSLTSLVAGKFYRFDLKNLGGGVDIDNGSLPTVSPGTWELDVPAGTASTPAEDKYYVNSAGLSFTSAVFKDTAGNVVQGTCQFRLDGGSLLNFADFTAAVAALPQAEIKSQQHDFSIVRSITSNVAGTLSLQLSA